MNDVIEVSVVCKDFYRGTRKNKFFTKKLSDIRRLNRIERIVSEYYYDWILCLSDQLSTNLKEYVSEENLLKVKKNLLSKFYHQILPFCVWNHIVLCDRSQFSVDISRSCTRLYVPNKKISDYINNNFFVEIDHFPVQISHEIIAEKKKYLFAHTNLISSRGDPFGLNFGGFYYESVTSPFLFWKTYLDILSRI